MITVKDYLKEATNAVLLEFHYPADGMMFPLEAKCKEVSREGYTCSWMPVNRNTVVVYGTLSQVAAVKTWAIQSDDTILNT